MTRKIEKTVENQEQESDSIDLEWLELFLDAQKIGLTANEVRNFFLANKICND